MPFFTQNYNLASNGKLKISSTDLTANYLINKLVAGSNITITQNNIGGNETITIASTGGSGGSPGGAVGDIQRNNGSGGFAGSSAMNFDGTSTLTLNGGGAGNFQLLNATGDLYISNYGTGDFIFSDGGTTRLILKDATGYVGIGNNLGTVAYTLDIQDTGNTLLRLIGSNADGPVIALNNTGGGHWFNVGSVFGSGAGSGYAIYDVTALAPRLIIDLNGNWGINTLTTANYQWNIDSGASNRPIRITSSNPDASIDFSNTDTGGHTFNFGSTSTASGAGAGFIVYDATAGYLASRIKSTGEYQVRGLTVGTGNFANSAPSDGAVIQGQVLIGSTSSSTKLHVEDVGVQAKFAYDASNYLTFQTVSNGDTTINAYSGAGGSFSLIKSSSIWNIGSAAGSSYALNVGSNGGNSIYSDGSIISLTTITAQGGISALSYTANGSAGANFGPGLPTSVTVVGGIVTAIS